MALLFKDESSFNQPLNKWDVSNVTDMSEMFQNATSFNQPLNNWNVSNVTNMAWMFANARSFNQPLNKWNVSKVRGMGYMFAEATSFNQPLNKWNVSYGFSVRMKTHLRPLGSSGAAGSRRARCGSGLSRRRRRWGATCASNA